MFELRHQPWVEGRPFRTTLSHRFQPIASRQRLDAVLVWKCTAAHSAPNAPYAAASYAATHAYSTMLLKSELQLERCVRRWGLCL
jgi:hypothetical protein